MKRKKSRAGTIPTVTLWQPWATLVAKRLKRVETRTSGWHWRGMNGRTLAIHAGLRLDMDAWDEVMKQDRAVGMTVRERASKWPRGVVVAVGRVGDMWLCTGDDRDDEAMSWCDASRAALCDARQKVCIEVSDVHELVKPVPARGCQGRWNWRPPPYVVEELVGTGLLEGLEF